MLDLDHLRVADFYEWLGCQTIAAAQLGCNQSTVSRRSREARQLAAGRSSVAQQDFLSLERAVHQRWRFARARELRLHGYRWIQPLLRGNLPESWRLNPAEVSVTPVCPLQLLGDHVIDALLAPWPVVAGLDRRRFALFPVYSTPMLLLAPAAGSLALETGLGHAEIAGSSQLRRLSFVPPSAWDCTQQLDGQLFGTAATPSGETGVEGRYWGMALTPLIRTDLVALPWEIPIGYGEFLVCLRDWSGHGQMERLLAMIRRVMAFESRDRAGLETLAVA